MEIIQTHQDSFGHEEHPTIRYKYFGDHPDPEVQKTADEKTQELNQQIRRFQGFVDTTPNLNADYTEEVALTRGYFESAGLSIAPIAILDRSSFRTASSLSGGGSNTIEGGFYAWERTVVADDDPERHFGTDLILGRLLHESAHSTASSNEKTWTISRASFDTTNEELRGGREFAEPIATSGFHKVRGRGWRGTTRVGYFWEEAFADLARVRALASFGREPKADGGEVTAYDDKVGYVGTGLDRPLVDNRDGAVNIPMHFAGTAKKNSDDRVIFTPTYSGIAAYGLDLLDKEVPGLYDAFLASRGDPSKQSEVIQMINSVQPGLYRELQSLRYSVEDFKAGLIFINKVIEARNARN